MREAEGTGLQGSSGAGLGLALCAGWLAGWWPLPQDLRKDTGGYGIGMDIQRMGGGWEQPGLA